jgi:UDP-N-acetylglucosamine 3-dehydrogenase
MISKVAIIGLGYWGKALLGYFRDNPGANVVAVHDQDAQRLRGIELGGANFYPDLTQMLDHEKLDAVVIAIPPPFHLIPTRLAAQRGVHVFCEKPMAATLTDCDEMIDVCEQNKVKLMIAFKHRFARAFSYVKNSTADLGKPLWGMYTYPLWKVDNAWWKFDEKGTKGIIVENMVHALDAMRYLFGDVERIYAEGDNYVFKEFSPPDSAILVMRFANGAIGAIGGGCTSDQRISREYLDAHFERGVAQISGMLDAPYNLRLLKRDDERPEEHFFEGSDGVREEITHFLDCIQNDKPLIATGTDGRKALELALATLESIRTHKNQSL